MLVTHKYEYGANKGVCKEADLDYHKARAERFGKPIKIKKLPKPYDPGYLSV